MSRVLRLADQAAFEALQAKAKRSLLGSQENAVPANKRDSRERPAPTTRSSKPADYWPRVLAEQIVAAGMTEPVREYTFAPPRRWRFDLAWPQKRVAVEVDGGVHRIKGRFLRDIEKHNAALFDYWWVFRVTPTMVRDGSALELVRRILR